MRPVWFPGSLSHLPPYNPPLNTAFLHRKSPRKFVQKTSHLPVGGMGNGFRPIDGPKNAAIIRGKRRPTGHRPANRHRPHGHGDQKGEVNMTTPTASELSDNRPGG